MKKTIDLRKTKPEEIAHIAEESLVSKEKEEVEKDAEGGTIKWRGPLSSSRPDKRVVMTVVAGLLAVAVLVVVLNGDFIASIFLALLGIMIQVQSGKKNIDGDIKITEHGFHLDDRFYPMNTVKSFWLDYMPDGPQELSVRLAKWHMPYLKIPIHGRNPLPIRDLLIQFAPEEEHDYTFVDLVREKLGL